MLTAFRLALSDAFALEQRRALLLSLALAVLVLFAVWLGVTAALHHSGFTGVSWLDASIEVLGSLAALVVSWMLFPAMTMLVLGFFLDRVVAVVERRHYPGLPPARRLGISETLGSALRISLLAIVINVIVLPFYLIPVINLFIYYGLNGYLVGREYFGLIALRRLEGGAARAMWRWHRGRLVLAGVIIVFLLSLPLFNLMAPIVAAAFMLHVFEGLRRRAVDETFAA